MGQLFEQCCLGSFPLKMGNTFLTGYFRSVMYPVSHLIAFWPQTWTKVARQHCSKSCHVYHQPMSVHIRAKCFLGYKREEIWHYLIEFVWNSGGNGWPPVMLTFFVTMLHICNIRLKFFLSILHYRWFISHVYFTTSFQQTPSSPRRAHSSVHEHQAYSPTNIYWISDL